MNKAGTPGKKSIMGWLSLAETTKTPKGKAVVGGNSTAGKTRGRTQGNTAASTCKTTRNYDDLDEEIKVPEKRVKNGQKRPRPITLEDPFRPREWTCPICGFQIITDGKRGGKVFSWQVQNHLSNRHREERKARTEAQAKNRLLRGSSASGTSGLGPHQLMPIIPAVPAGTLPVDACWQCPFCLDEIPRGDSE